MDRKQELIEIIGKDNQKLLLPLINQVLFLENQLEQLKEMPFIKVNPNNPLQQKMLPAFRIYKETLQQYTNCVKVVARASGIDDTDEESPLRQWVKKKIKEGDGMGV